MLMPLGTAFNIFRMKVMRYASPKKVKKKERHIGLFRSSFFRDCEITETIDALRTY